MPRPNWSRPLPRQLVIPTVMTLKTLADVHNLIGHLPATTRKKSTWRHVAKCLNEAAARGAHPARVYAALRMVLSMEGVECRAK